jgi:lysophospholipase L1-like esterase
MRRSLYGMLGLLAACGDDAATGKAAPDAATLRPDAAIVAPREDAWTAPDDAGVVPVDGPGDARDAAVPGMDAAPAVPDAAAPGADATPATPDAASPAVDAALVGPDAAPPVADAAPPALDAAAPAPAQTASACFERVFGRAIDLGPNYDQFAPTIADHCQGTNHQAIAGVQRVVFVGDSVTVGTPPTQPRDFYRTRLANSLAQRFGLQAPDAIWQNVNLIDGGALSQESGDFASCAKFGARTDDLRRDNDQLERCLPEAERDKTTLIVMTMGGNYVASVTQDGLEGRAVDELWGETMEFVDLLRDALEWIRTPGRFPNGVFVVFANLYEFTDGTAETDACPAAALGGFGGMWDDPQALRDMVIWANEQYLRIAVETQTDMVFMLEGFCGHGFRRDDPEGPCYRGPGAEAWFDLTCIHPSPEGHRALADMFTAVVEE